MSLKFKSDNPLTVAFPSGEFDRVKGNFGPQFLYRVRVNGSPDMLYASEKLHKSLQEANVRSGSRFVIVRQDNGNRTAWKVEPAGDSPSSPAPPVPPPPALQPSEQADQKGPEPTTPASSESEALARGLFGLMARCLRESLKAWQWLGENFTADNVQATANTLFIACKDRDIILPAVPYPGREQMEALARIGDAILPEQNAWLQKRVSEGITWTEAQAIIDYYEQNHKQASKAA